ncbi:MAG: IS110 family transposase [Bryobacteraceae bacterium]
MKKRNTTPRMTKPRHRKQSKHQRKARSGRIPNWTIGVDLGDEESSYCVLNKRGEVVEEASVLTDREEFGKFFQAQERSRVVMETGTHSPWVSRCAQEAQHEVIVANARKVKLISQSSSKDDRMDAETLARLGRADVKLMAPIQHRGEEAQADLVVIRARAALVRARTMLVNTARGLVKSLGERLPGCEAERVNPASAGGLSPDLQKKLKPVLESAAVLSQQIASCDVQIAVLCKERYPETERLMQVYGVGPVIALTFVLTLDNPERFERSREVGPYLGMRPGRRNSGQSEPQLRITKEGDGYLRSLLVQAAHCALRQNAPDSDLKRFGLKLSKRGGKNARKRAKVAVARKLAVLLHRLWKTGAKYDPLYNQKAKAAQKAKPARKKTAA